MYNKSLDVFKTVAENSSFSKAAEQLYISHTAVIKQINQLENHLGVKLVQRSTHGTSLTNAGQQLYKETLQIMRFSADAIKRVQEAYTASPEILRIGSSILYPCHAFMEIWDTISEKCPQYQLQMVTFEDDEKRLEHLNENYDFIIGAYNEAYDLKGHLFFPIGMYRFCLAMSKKHPLAKKKSLSFKDLAGEQLMIMKTGSSPINDKIRQEIIKNYPQIILENISPHYNINTFNRCLEENAILLSLECWDSVHPALATVTLKEEYYLPYGIVLSEKREQKMDDFIAVLQHAL